MSHPALAPGRVAVVTGAASGIGLATCKRLAERGMLDRLAGLDRTTGQGDLSRMMQQLGVANGQHHVRQPVDGEQQQQHAAVAAVSR